MDSGNDGIVPRNNFIAQLEDAKSVVEVVNFRARMVAIEAAARAKKAMEPANLAAEFRIRAERRAGEILAETPKHTGGRPRRNQSNDATGLSTLSDLGITKDESSRWQAEARIPDTEFEGWVSQTKSEGNELTSVGLLKLRERRERFAEYAEPHDCEICEKNPSEFPMVFDPWWYTMPQSVFDSLFPIYLCKTCANREMPAVSEFSGTVLTPEQAREVYPSYKGRIDKEGSRTVFVVLLHRIMKAHRDGDSPRKSELIKIRDIVFPDMDEEDAIGDNEPPETGSDIALQ